MRAGLRHLTRQLGGEGRAHAQVWVDLRHSGAVDVEALSGWLRTAQARRMQVVIAARAAQGEAAVSLTKGLAAGGADVCVRCPGSDAGELAPALVAAGARAIRGVVGGDSREALPRRLWAFRPPMAKMRLQARGAVEGMRRPTRGAIAVEVSLSVATKRAVELPMLLLGVGKLRPRALFVNLVGSVSPSFSLVLGEALKATQVEARRLRCAVIVQIADDGGSVHPPLPDALCGVEIQRLQEGWWGDGRQVAATYLWAASGVEPLTRRA